MSSFVVSARKYRPQRFDEVVGQEHISLTLKNAIQNDQLAHAFLFCGPRGVGKTTCARILAKVINCTNRTKDFEACDTCPSCTSFNQSTSFNTIELDAASNNSVEHIRALTEQVRFQPQQGEYKVFIIDEVHMLSQQAFNAFLKTLEEPPAYAIFILATTEKHKIIPTILSRCQIFDFKRIPIPRIVAHLEHVCQQEGITAEKEALHIIAQKADGALRDALSIFDRMVSFSNNSITYDSVIENLNILDYDYYFELVEAIMTEDISRVLLTFDEIYRKGFEPDIFINGLAAHLRNLLVCKHEETAHLLDISETLKKRYLAQATIVPSDVILTALDIANDCDVNYKMARHKRLHVEMAIIKMTYISRAATLMNNPAAAIEKKNPDVNNQKVLQKTISKPHTPNISKESTHKETNSIAIASAPEPIPAPPPQLEEVNSNPAPPTEVPTPPSVVAPTVQTAEKTPNSSLSLGKKTKYDMPSLVDLAKVEEEQEKVEEEGILEMESLQTAWQSFIAEIQSQGIKESFKSALLSIKDSKSVEVEVGSKLSKQMILQEKKLIPYLRKELRIPRISLKVNIDPERAKKLVKTKKVASPQKKYESMCQKNPLIKDLTKRLDLKPDV